MEYYFKDERNLRNKIKNFAARFKNDGRGLGETIIKYSRSVHNMDINGIYFLMKDDLVVYIGQSRNVITRIMMHRRDKRKLFNRYYVIRCSRSDNYFYEKIFMDLLKPIYNLNLKFENKTKKVSRIKRRKMIEENVKQFYEIFDKLYDFKKSEEDDSAIITK